MATSETNCSTETSEILQIFQERFKDFDFTINPPQFNLLFTLLEQYKRVCEDTGNKKLIEKMHSKMLAGIFAKDKDKVFLRHFLKSIGVENFPDDDASFVIEPSQNNGWREHGVIGSEGTTRFIDILIRWKTSQDEQHAVIIENKFTGAEEQPKQLFDYFNGVKKEGIPDANIRVVFMPWDYCLPKSAGAIPIKSFPADLLIKTMETYRESRKSNNRLVDEYLEFLNTLKNEKVMTIHVQKIIEQLHSQNEILKIEKLAAIVSIDGWGWQEAKFQALTTYLKTHCDDSIQFDLMKATDDNNYYGCYQFGDGNLFVAIGVQPAFPDDATQDGKVSFYLADPPRTKDRKKFTLCEIEFGRDGAIQKYNVSESKRYYPAYSPNNGTSNRFYLPMNGDEANVDPMIPTVLIPILKELKNMAETKNIEVTQPI